MEGNGDAFLESGSAGIQVVLNNPKLLLFDTNWWEDSYQRLVALNIQDEVPISAAFAFPKGSEFLHMFNHFLKKLREGGIVHKVNEEWSLREELNFELEPAVTLGFDNLAFPGMIFVGGLAVACTITLCEKLLFQLKDRITRKASTSCTKHSSKDHIAIQVIFQVNTSQGFSKPSNFLKMELPSLARLPVRSDERVVVSMPNVAHGDTEDTAMKKSSQVVNFAIMD